MRVLIVDDHPIIVSGCRSLLEGEPDIEIIEAQDGAAGFGAFFSERPDVGVIDINLPGYSGLELLRRILEREPEARLVIFSMNDDPTVAARAIEAGAKGYIAKNDDPTLFADAIKTVANGGRYLHPEMARRIAFLRADPGPDALSNLSPRELEILRLLAAGRTMAQIADLLNVSYKT
ncbi:MAG TPA: response regulator transcription factor, partial [Roseiarcus sp.]